MKLNNVEIKRLELGPWGTNTYIIICRKTGDSVLIDAPSEASIILKSLQNTNPKYILLTHTHIDHIDALPELRPKLKTPLATHAADSTRLQAPPDMLLNDGDVVSFGKAKLEVLHTPGHTPGSLCFKIDKCLLSGDTIFPGGPGRTGSPTDLKQIIESIIDKILVLPDDTEILPGHGDFTTVKKERDDFAIFAARPHDPNLCGHVHWRSAE